MSMRSLSFASFALLLLAAQSTFAATPPCSCLVELWVDYPGPYDLYIAEVHQISCDDEPWEELWYGLPNSDIPQYCENGNCEPYEDGNQRAAAILPGHGQELVGVKAWDVFRVGFESATRKMPGLEFGSPEYHIIPRANLPESLKAKTDMTVMAVAMKISAKDSRLDGKTLYMCVQMDSAEGVPITRASFEKGKSGTGSQLHIDYKVKGGEVRRGLVWLK
jgi:hypothetical protein